MKRRDAPLGATTMQEIPLYPDFPKEEYAARYERARQLMATQGLDALLVTDRTNSSWFTGIRNQNRADKVRPSLVLVPREGDPVALAMTWHIPHIEETTWMRGVRPFQLFKHVDALVETLQSLNLERGRIGCELGREQYLSMNYMDFGELVARMPRASFVDASETFLNLRAIKSPAEIERCRRAASAGARALEEALGQVRPGMTTAEVAHLVRCHVVQHGCERVTFMAIRAGQDFTRNINPSVPSTQVLQVGDTLTVDIGAEMDGYSCDVCRMVVIGEASQRQKDFYKFLLELHDRCFEAIRPGNLLEAPALVCAEVVKNAGMKLRPIGRIGHGVGRDCLEYPSLAVGEKMAFAPGMIVTCNPNFETEFGFFNTEEDLLLTETGFEVLSTPAAPRELRVVG